jgi:3-hydroxyisobutyrate dehydrogenase-like beta-hydroxyacid dehydrogenase
MRIGFVGAGRIGAPMVGRLVDAGHEVQVLGRADEKRAAAAELGAIPVAGATDTAAGADVVIVCVFTDDQVREVAPDLIAAMAHGAVLVLHNTGSPRTAEMLAADGTARGVDVVDAPVSGGPHDIAAGRVTLWVGGTDAALERARPALSAYGDPVLHVGPIGSGQKVKLVNNTLFAAQIGLVAEAARLGARLGIGESALLDALPHGSGASKVMGNIARAGSTSRFIGAVGEFLGKDVGVVRKTLAELGADLGRLDDLVNAGLGT